MYYASVTMVPKPVRTPLGLRGEVIHIDHFGNVASNIRVEQMQDVLARKHVVTVRLDGTEIRGLVDTFGERPVGDLIALFGSTGNLIISVVNGSAAQRLKAALGQTKKLWHKPDEERDKTNHEDYHEQRMMKNHPQAAQNGDVFAHACRPIGERLRAGIDSETDSGFGAMGRQGDGASSEKSHKLQRRI